MIFTEPRLLWLTLLAPLAAVLAAWMWRERLRAVSAWASRNLWDRLYAGHEPRRIVLSVGCLALSLLAVSLALARPRWGMGEEVVERQGVDVVFVIDSSLSMGALDVQPSRLFVAKALVRRLAGEMPQNRIALVLAEGTGEVFSPLTVDAAVVDLLLDTLVAGSLPKPGTELAAALNTAAGLFFEGEDKHRVLILLSDGEDHGGGLAERGQKLAERGIVVHALGVGTLEGAPIPIPGGRPGETKTDRGKVVISALGEAHLEALARSTGGVYLRVTSPAVDTSAIPRRIEEMGTSALETQTITTLRERFQWPLSAAALALTLYLGVAPFARSADPRKAAS